MSVSELINELFPENINESVRNVVNDLTKRLFDYVGTNKDVDKQTNYFYEKPETKKLINAIELLKDIYKIK